jgi:integrase
VRVFQPTYTDRKGKTRKSSRYHVSFKDHAATPRRVVAFADKAASESLGRKLESLAAFRANNDPLPPELARWLDGVDDDLRAQLTTWGMIDTRASMASMALAAHVQDWHDDIVNRGKTAAHATLIKSRVLHLFTGCGFGRYADISESTVNTYLAKRRALMPSPDGKASVPGISIRTANFYAKAAQQFCRWMIRNKRALDNPLAGTELGDPETDRRRVRRALSVDELGRLIASAQADKAIVNGATGAERAIIYRLASETGLRTNEIRTLTRESFDLDSEQPGVTVAVCNSKRRKQDVLPIRSELAAALRLHLATKLPGARAFRACRETAKMIRHDMEAAGIAETTAAGVVDFHSLRGTFITNLARGGVHPKMAQRLARHSTIELTMNTYTKLATDELRPALDALPTFPAAAAG